jgi:hypothetical protein
MRYRTEAGTHKASKRTHQEQMDAMQAQLTDLQEQLRVTKASVPLPPVDVAEYFSPEEIEKYGREQCETMARVARQTAEKQADAKVREAVEPLKQQTQASQTRARESAHDQFYGELARIIPNWREIDAMPKWLAWLEEPDPETGLLYGEILDRHAKALNAQQVAKIMQKWQRSQAHPAPPVAPSSSAGAPTLDTQPPSEDALPQGLTPLRRGEAMEYYKRAALNKVSDEERRVFESRLRLGRP